MKSGVFWDYLRTTGNLFNDLGPYLLLGINLQNLEHRFSEQLTVGLFSEGQFILDTDGSNTGIANTGKDKIIEFYSI